MKTKICSKCLEEKSIENFNADLSKKDKKYSSCKKCVSKRTLLYRQNNVQKLKIRKKEYRSNNKELIKKEHQNWTDKNREYVNNKKKEWKHNNKDKVKISNKKYTVKNKKKLVARVRKRQADKQQRTPKWADFKAIEEFYANCPDGHEVDHIVPLKGKIVSGLHTLENLQYLSKEKNRSKRNNFNPEDHYGKIYPFSPISE